MFGKSTFAALVLVAAGTTQASDLALEPCVNGDVSQTGTWPTQLTEGNDQAQLDWQSYDPYYLFAVSASYLKLPFEDDTPVSDRQ